jgi:hypothetical protein
MNNGGTVTTLSVFAAGVVAFYAGGFCHAAQAADPHRAAGR